MSEEEIINPDDIFSESVNENEIFKAISIFFEDLATKTDIPSKKISYILKILFLSNTIKKYDKTDAEIVENVIDQYYRLRISNSRKGRTEAFQTLQRLGGYREEEPKGLLRRFFGKR